MAIASAIGLPVSCEISSAMFSSSFKIIFRAFITTRPRSRNNACDHERCASRARPTARATSSGVAMGARPISAPVTGLREASSALSGFAVMVWAINRDYRPEVTGCQYLVWGQYHPRERMELGANASLERLIELLTPSILTAAYPSGTDFTVSATMPFRIPIASEEIAMIKPQLAEFMRRMDPNSVAIIPAAREAVRSHDTNYRYRQNSDFFYLTGFEEPEAIAVIAPAKEKKFTMFVRPRDMEQEIWNGYRAGVEGAKKDYSADEAFPVSEFDAKLAEILDGPAKLYYAFGNGSPELDEKLIRQLAILHEMRVFKSQEEIEIMQRAADIAAEAHVEAMKAVRPGMKEYEVEALIESIFRRHGSAGPSYTSIIGSGANATVLHYISNQGTLRDGDLLLVDAGAEYQGYASDITRTFPIDGKFTQAQRDVYDLVLKTQMSCIDMVRPGVRLEDLKTHSIEMLTEGMVELGLLKGEPAKLIEEKKYMQFYMHNLGHFLGIDVHDAGRYYFNGESRPAEPGMVMTIEPGLYISPDTTRIPEGFNQDVPEKYLGIGVRIEDDVLVTENGARVLTNKVPKDPHEIEALMAK